MRQLETNELIQIIGGTSITGSLINAVGTIIKTILDVSRRVGSFIRRWQDQSFCEL